MTELTIAPLTSQHSAEISALAMRSKAHWGYSPAFLKQCEAELSYSAEQIAHKDYHFVAAWLAPDTNPSAPLGFYALQCLSSSQMELLALFICPSAISTGVGRVLLGHAIEFAKKQRATSLIVYSDPHAAGFYSRAGAVHCGYQASGSIPGRELPIYQFPLKETA
ncbi:MAG: GNAT family N-acetyltransferase [Paraglaciecola polaris]|uniref:GNAT family N-acetyltransferase n=1 Tax=Paraglaciecola polaris TaxID=222814 RepID=UPI0030019646